VPLLSTLPPRDTKLPLEPTHTKSLASPSMLSLADQKLGHTEETDMLVDVEDLTINEAVVDSPTVAEVVEELLEVEAPDNLRTHDFLIPT